MADATEPTRRCSHCGVVKPIVGGFYSDHRRRGRCRDCMRIEMRQRGDDRVAILRAYKMEVGCADCGYRGHPHALEFDHRPGETKVADVNKFRVRGTLAEMFAEMKKCDVVCANCHRIRTAERRDFANNAGWDLRRIITVPDAINLDELTIDGQLLLFEESD